MTDGFGKAKNEENSENSFCMSFALTWRRGRAENWPSFIYLICNLYKDISSRKYQYCRDRNYSNNNFLIYEIFIHEYVLPSSDKGHSFFSKYSNIIFQIYRPVIPTFHCCSQLVLCNSM